MLSSASAGSAAATPMFPSGSVAGAAIVRSALGRLRTLVSLALAVSVLVLVEGYLSSLGVFGKVPGVGGPFNLDWITAVQIGVGIAVGVSIGVLVVIALVFAILGLLAWRRGVLAMVSAGAEMGPAQESSCQTARRDHRTTLWLFLVLVLAAIVVSVAFAGVNGAMSWLGIGAVPGVVGSVATSLATGAVLVLIYYYGARHLSELLLAVASPTERSLLGRGSSWMVVGAIVGLGAAFSPVSWAFNGFVVISLAMILPGVGNLCRAYDLWLAERHAVWKPAPTAGTTAA